MIPLRTAWSTPVGLLSSVLLLACGGGDGGGMTGPNGDRSVTERDVNLAPGEAATFTTGGDVLALRLPSAGSGREYRLTVQPPATGPSEQVVPMRLARSTGGSASGAIVSAALSDAAGTDPAGPGVLRARARDLSIRSRIQQNSRELLVRRGIAPARPAAADDGGADGSVRTATQLPSGSTPGEGDTLQFSFAVQEDLSIVCDTAQAETLTAVVEDSASRALIVQDTAAPGPLEGGFTDQDFQRIAATFDTLVVPTDSAYFGRPTDIDDNGRIYILFTPRVNQLDPDDGDTQVGGFFVSRDLAESGDGDDAGAGDTCPASNEAELLYLRSPDPEGRYGNRTFADTARRNAFSVSSHELQHLLNTANRVIKNSGGSFFDLETTWLDEGLSHLAEEVVGLAALDAPVRSNLTLSQTAGQDAEAFNTYLIADFFNAGLFMKNSPTARALAARDTSSLESLEMRGFSWMLVRWLADHRADATAAVPPASGEESLIRDLAQADGQELSTGIQNVEEATGVSFGRLLGDFGLMVAVDDTVAAAGGEQVLPTWNLRNMYRGLADNVGTFRQRFGDYPLRPVQAGFTADTTDFSVKPGAGKHFVFSSSGSTPELRLELTDQTGSALSVDARITIIRAR